MMVYSLIAEEERKKNGYSKSACFRMIGVSSSGYYSWLKRYEDKDGKRAQKKKELQDIQEKFRQIIRKLGFVPENEHSGCTCGEIMASRSVSRNAPGS